MGGGGSELVGGGGPSGCGPPATRTACTYSFNATVPTPLPSRPRLPPPPGVAYTGPTGFTPTRTACTVYIFIQHDPPHLLHGRPSAIRRTLQAPHLDPPTSCIAAAAAAAAAAAPLVRQPPAGCDNPPHRRRKRGRAAPPMPPSPLLLRPPSSPPSPRPVLRRRRRPRRMVPHTREEGEPCSGSPRSRLPKGGVWKGVERDCWELLGVTAPPSPPFSLLPPRRHLARGILWRAASPHPRSSPLLQGSFPFPRGGA
jgi:hypothetical protein